MSEEIIKILQIETDDHTQSSGFQPLIKVGFNFGLKAFKEETI